MSFSNKLWKIRDEADISQERLAQALDISRQAVAKWESGSSMPDIDNLIRLSNFFQVSLDFLLKDGGYPEPSAESKLEHSELIDFIVSAKKNTYASSESFNDSKMDATRLKSKDLAYESGAFKYWDTYVGGTNFSGSEVVYHLDIPVWSMNYNGHSLVEDSSDIIDLLMMTLSKVSPEMPYRGPAFFRNGKYTYTNTVTGCFNWFQGNEKIYFQDKLIYELVYHGGKVI